ncbi:MAG: hypothetical protein HQ518_18610 [Rhodopirellula sp.]|nr:hypothetical protein [Rhodopirellula sp.]
MQIQISDWAETDTCLWCSKDKESVTVTFDEGFLSAATLCWHCLQNAVRVCRQRQAADDESSETSGSRKTRAHRPAEDG